MRTLFGLTLLLLTSSPLLAENWPSWRGPANNGISSESNLPVKWSETENIAWKLPMPGKAGSTPAVWGDKIFLTSASDEGFVLLCVSTGGQVLWKAPISTGGRTAIRADEGNDASASPSTDGKLVYAFVGTGDFVCHDFAGKQIWHFNAQERYGKFKIQHGLHNTPLLLDDKIYMVLLHNNGHWIIALDKASGKEIWKVARPSDAKDESREAYSSPFLWKNRVDQQLVVLGCDYVTGHSLKDGSELWRVGELNPKSNYSGALRIIASPVGNADSLVVPTARGGLIVAVKAGLKGNVGPGSSFELWRKSKGAPDVPSPLIVGEQLYLPRETGVLQGWDVNTGANLYEERLFAGRYRASPVYGDGKVYLAARDGVFSVVKAGPKFELLATNQLNDTFTASPAIADGRIYLRGFSSLYAIEAKK